MTPKLSHGVSEQSVRVCQQLGITGRVFANDIQALAITEGETALVRRYYEAVKADILVDNIVLLADRQIEAREFSDYSVWLNSREHYDCGPHVRRLTLKSLEDALPGNPSGKIRVMVEGYLKPELLSV